MMAAETMLIGKLKNYHRMNGHYPDSTKALSFTNSPQEIQMLPEVRRIQYRRTAQGYEFRHASIYEPEQKGSWSGASTKAQASEEAIAPGMVDYHGVDISQALSLYGRLANVELEISPEAQVLNRAIYFTNEKMTRSALLHRYEELLHDQGGVVLKRLDEKRVAVTVDPSASVFSTK